MNSKEILLIPRGRDPQLGAISIELGEINRIEARVQDIARATPLTIAELITDFNVGLLILAKAISQVELEKKEAAILVKELRAVTLLDKADDVLRSKNQKSSADLREAVVNSDPEVVSATRRLDSLTVASEFLNSKMHAIELAYHGAKKVCDVYMKLPASPNYGGDNE